MYFQAIRDYCSVSTSGICESHSNQNQERYTLPITLRKKNTLEIIMVHSRGSYKNKVSLWVTKNLLPNSWKEINKQIWKEINSLYWMTPLPFISMGVTVSRVGLGDSNATNTNDTLATQNNVMNQYIRTYTFVSLKHSWHKWWPLNALIYP